MPPISHSNGLVFCVKEKLRIAAEQAQNQRLSDENSSGSSSKFSNDSADSAGWKGENYVISDHEGDTESDEDSRLTSLLVTYPLPTLHALDLWFPIGMQRPYHCFPFLLPQLRCLQLICP